MQNEKIMKAGSYSTLRVLDLFIFRIIVNENVLKMRKIEFVGDSLTPISWMVSTVANDAVKTQAVLLELDEKEKFYACRIAKRSF